MKGTLTPTRRELAGFGLVALAIVLAYAYVLSRLDPASHVAVVDELATAGSWEMVHTDAYGTGNILFGSAVQRFYVADADPDELVAWTTGMLVAAGFTIAVYTESSDWCDNRPVRATPEIVCPTKVRPACWTLSPGSPMQCSLRATRGEDRLSVVATDRGQTVDYHGRSQPQRIGGPDRIVVAVTVTY